jgi:mannose-6-phosphate isomerase-like protein (cupin superfamily)
MGISYQTHELREEIWEIVKGNPILIINDKIEYKPKKGKRYVIPLRTLHSIINPTENWVVLKEKYTGIFDESDILRIYNPNNYI